MASINKLNVWLHHYLDQTNPDTFLNKTESARAAGYKTKDPHRLGEIGYQNSKKLQKRINTWLDESGLSEAALKEKLVELLFAKETKFFQKDGKITEQVDVNNYGVQRQALEMAFKIKGMFEKDNAQRGQVDQEARQEFMRDLFQTISQANGRGLPEPRE
jgi:phage terminase small subunit